MKREVSIALFAIITLAAAIWGFKYLRGNNILGTSYEYNILLSDVSELNVSSPVYLNGLQVGAVSNIELNPEDPSQMVVHFRLEGDYHVPKSAVINVKNVGVMGGKGLYLNYKKICQGGDCAPNNFRLNANTLGMVQSLVGDDADRLVNNLSTEVNKVVDHLGAEDADGSLHEAIRELKKSLQNIATVSARSNAVLAASQKDITAAMTNLSSITKNIADNNIQITEMIQNMGQVTKDLADAHLDKKLDQTITNLNKSLNGLEGTLATSDKTIAGLNDVVTKINTGDGSMSRLINDKQLYDNLEKTSNNLSLLLQDLRLNPKRYVNVSIFGKKGKAYTVPEDDPAYKENPQK